MLRVQLSLPRLAARTTWRCSQRLPPPTVCHALRALSTSRQPDTPPVVKTAKELHENIYTIPNILSFTRLAASPVLGYLVATRQYTPAVCLFGVAAVTDLLDGFIARRYNMMSVVGTILDPMADKVLMTTLTVSLAYAELLPVPLAALIVGRDVGLVLASFYIRYRTLPEPKTFKRYWDFSLPSAEVHPTAISKANTALQLVLVGSSLVSPLLGPYMPSLATVVLPGLQGVVGVTTLWSGLSYVFSKDAVKVLKQHK
ncbi:hypothetical protein RI367_008030 [Sorochytrium milnesiophthora]